MGSCKDVGSLSVPFVCLCVLFRLIIAQEEEIAPSQTFAGEKRKEMAKGTMITKRSRDTYLLHITQSRSLPTREKMSLHIQRSGYLTVVRNKLIVCL